MKLQLEAKHREIVFEILRKYHYAFYAFGSRVKGTAKRFSDLDLCYKEPIPDSIVSHIEEDFEQSDLPFKVDLVSFSRCTEDFKKRIEEDGVKII